MIRKAGLMGVVVLAACGGGMLVRPTPTSGTGAVYVYRKAKFAGAAWNAGASIVNGGGQIVRTMRVRSGKYVVTEVPAGSAQVAVAAPGGGTQLVSLGVPDQGAVFVRCELSWGKFLCEQVAPAIGEGEARDCKQNVKGD